MHFTAILFTVLVLAPCVVFGEDDTYCVCFGNKVVNGIPTPFATSDCPQLMGIETPTESNGCACIDGDVTKDCGNMNTDALCESMCASREYACGIFYQQPNDDPAPSNTVNPIIGLPPKCSPGIPAPPPPILCPGTFTVTFAALTADDCTTIRNKAQTQAPDAVFVCDATSRTLSIEVEDGCIDYTTTTLPPQYQQFAEGLTVEEFKGVCENQCGVPSGSTCFPADAVVVLEDGMTLRMDALKVGHKVRVGPKEHSEVFMFSHQYTDAQATFVKLQTATGAIQLTESHYLFVNGKAAQASTVKVGDLLETATGAPAAVTGISTVRATGLYNPHTMQGDIIVNGIRTSTYTDAITPTLAHAMLAPIRALYSMNVTVIA